MAVITLHANAMAYATAEASCSVKRGATGRLVESLSRVQQAEELLVMDWLRAESAEQRHPARLLVENALRTVPVATPLHAFRGRNFPLGYEPAANEFGPPPEIRPNRYNRADQRALYLCSSELGVRREVNTGDGEALFYQRFDLTRMRGRLADLADPSIASVLNHAFDLAERPDRHYLPGQCVADAVRAVGWDGMVVPGVRGSVSARYTNIVLFDPSDWEVWVDHSAPPISHQRGSD